jgi:hypothetical protein
MICISLTKTRIVPWKDYGESHYIDPLHASSEIPPGSAVYDENNPHDSWRDFLPYHIATYKGNSFDVTVIRCSIGITPSLLLVVNMWCRRQ